jgi:hypothetical protein
MKSPRSVLVISLIATLGLVSAACDSGDAELSTTSSLIAGDGTLAGEPDGDGGSTTTVPGDGESDTSTTLRGTNVDSYEVVAREPSDDGEVLFIVIPQADYTDVDLENFVGDLIERDIVTSGAEIFDDVLALDAFRVPEADRTEAETELLVQHHFASVVNADTLVFRGPFESLGEMAIGS